MDRITEIPAKSRKWRRYIRKVSSSRSPISSGRRRSGAEALTVRTIVAVCPLGRRPTYSRVDLDWRATRLRPHLPRALPSQVGDPPPRQLTLLGQANAGRVPMPTLVVKN